MSEINVDILKQELKDALKEVARLRVENQNLRAENQHFRDMLKLPDKTPSEIQIVHSFIDNENKENQLSDQTKVELFRSLFRGREDVYAVHWEGRNGSNGYAPACKNERLPGICIKPKVKCQECPNRDLLPLTDQVIIDHLKGKRTIGVYPLLQDETCWFLAVDFDKKTWQDDAAAFLEKSLEMKIPAVLERSRSGNGGHVWIFFNRPIPAVTARQLGSIIRKCAQQNERSLSTDSFDRFFPSQDTMPKGEFGNLIALPFQGIPSKSGNSVFIDMNFRPYPKQWTFLMDTKKITREEVERIIAAFTDEHSADIVKDATPGEKQALRDEEIPWKLPTTRKEASLVENLPLNVRVFLSNLIYVEKKDLPPVIVKMLRELATFSNPEFYQAQKLRLPTYDKPRIIDCSEDLPCHIGLPRGCLEKMVKVFADFHIQVEFMDKRNTGAGIDVSFLGDLSPRQKAVLMAIGVHDNGVLSASTAFGKTVVAINLIAERKVNTLILVHRSQLMDQWKEQLAVFFGIPLTSIGEVGGGKDTRTGIIDVAMLQSVVHQNEVKDFVAEYG